MRRRTGPGVVSSTASASATAAGDGAAVPADEPKLAPRPRTQRRRDVSYHLTRRVVLHLVGLVYATTFAIGLIQDKGLLGPKGLFPVHQRLDAIQAHYAGDLGLSAQSVPSLIWWSPLRPSADSFAPWLALHAVGCALALVPTLTGAANVPIMLALHAIHVSVALVSSPYSNFMWYMLANECGWLWLLSVPLWSLRQVESRSPWHPLAHFLLRLVLWKLMLGAGLIKMRGDECWTQLRCLDYHYETQPLPNPLAYYLHHLPAWVQTTSVFFNHFVELFMPWFVLTTSTTLCRLAGVLNAVFQLALITSGNLAFLNHLTLALSFVCIDDDCWLLLPIWSQRTRRDVAAARQHQTDAGRRSSTQAWLEPRTLITAVAACAILVATYNGAVLNMLSDHQAMNKSFDRMQAVNTYGAFGSVNKVRRELVLFGTTNATASRSDYQEWKEYSFPCKPGPLDRAPCATTPYYQRLDWHLWFASMSTYGSHRWLARLADGLMQGNQDIMSLLASDGNPFPHGILPVQIKAELYTYSFTKPFTGSKDWWTRERYKTFMNPRVLPRPPT